MNLSSPLHSQRKLNLLNDIDKLRSQGASQYIDLPQLIVCGDQSSGKSSLLEAISGIPFPTKDNFCTRFATEVILRHSSEESVHIQIVSDQEAASKRESPAPIFQRELSSFDRFAELVNAALKHMTDCHGEQAFYKDVLQLKVSGPNQPHLTIVDLPGLINSPNISQTQADVDVVQAMVSAYIKQPRSIILAVVSAKSDHPLQLVLRLVQELDPHGTRTLGIITKPDELREGSDSEAAYIRLAENKDIKTRLGWHAVRNRDYRERNCTSAERNENEFVFFNKGVWRALPREDVGIETLRPKLSEILFEQIKQQLPDLIDDIQVEIKVCEDTLSRLGPSRSTITEQRYYLVELSQKFQRIVQLALNGTYDDEFFGDASSDNGEFKRLRAIVQNANVDFANSMEEDGQERKIVDDNEKEEASRSVIRRCDLLEEIKALLKVSRGRELAGLPNPMLVTDLFRKHSSPWDRLARSHITRIWKATKTFLDLVVEDISSGSTADELLSKVIDPSMNERQTFMLEKMEEILDPFKFGHPITYNHELIQKIQDRRATRSKTDIANLIGTLGRGGVHTVSIETLQKTFTPDHSADVDRSACIDLLDYMEAYYEIAMRLVIDTVAIYSIERCLLVGLDKLFSPGGAALMSDDLVRAIAAEPAQNQHTRDQNNQKLRILRQGLVTVQAHTLRDNDGVDEKLEHSSSVAPTTNGEENATPEAEATHQSFNRSQGEAFESSEAPMDKDLWNFDSTRVKKVKKSRLAQMHGWD